MPPLFTQSQFIGDTSMNQFLDATFWKEFFTSTRHWFINELPGLVVAILIFLIAFKAISLALNKIQKALVARSSKNTKQDPQEVEKRITTLVAISYGFIKIILWGTLAMIVLQKFGVDIAPILAGAGIVGLAIGFGAQELVRDFISGFFIILENQIRTGDVAIINGTGGLVEKIEFRTVTLRDFSGIVHIFQNGKINSISNMTKDWSAMVFDIGVAYKENPETVMGIMKKVGDDLFQDPEFKDKIMEPIEIFGLDQFADSALIIKARIITKPIQQWTIGREYRKRLKFAFDQNKIEIPFPHTTVYWGDKINPLKLDLNNQILDKIK
jgi:small conductance mechanosensitive channel